jgi:hypothetical protein
MTGSPAANSFELDVVIIGGADMWGYRLRLRWRMGIKTRPLVRMCRPFKPDRAV